MKAIRYRAYGPPDVLELQEVGKPEAGDDEVLIRVRAASVNPGDWHLMRGSPYIFRAVAGLTRPKAHVLGFDLAGQVEAVGKDVTKFQPGDEVYGVCKGAFAEYVTVPEGGPVARKPAALTYEEAAAVPTAGLTALQGVRDKAQVGRRKVLVNGASGGVGTFAVQLAKVLGAEVTAVCSGRNADLVRSIGADHVIDYTKEDFTRGTQKYDLILDNIANRSLAACRRVLAPRGTFVHNSGSGGPWVGVVGRIVLLLVSSLFVRQKLVSLMTKENADDLAALGRMLESRDIAPVIDRTYRLSDVPEAVGYLERGHARGKVVITL
ncbi:NAD(P)-dependent alcohol dehydrogenase [Nonomuraea longispora]|uniref:NAD(P)-dependent alcohol dehydrogenase n=1 Tax=Nonomuraea longispora TaxID=1848320 RepID=A0A4R4N938_9ACTN|nr:NAD(P)-dependent alcohol dehydrogenase [Nonomuraea longispora]TDC05471.1 NAD(P)-dependent alcohol dehydrogenase [Nonomuraea longispora]